MIQSITVRDYQSLGLWAENFHLGKLGFVVLHGPPGTAKSQLFSSGLPDDCIIQGRLTGVMFFMRLFWVRDEPIIIDDVDDMLKDRQCVNLLKLLCQTQEQKFLQWNTASKILEEEGIPRAFSTKSHVTLITNDIGRVNAHLAAVLDRSHPIEFVPSHQEMHRYAGQWFTDTEIYDYVGEHLQSIPEHSLRYYVKAKELKAAGMDWRLMLREQWQVNGKLIAVLALLKDPNLKSTAAKVQRFIELGHGSRDTFMRWQRVARRMLANEEQPGNSNTEQVDALAERVMVH